MTTRFLLATRGFLAFLILPLLAPASRAEEGFVDWIELADVVRGDGPAVVRVPTAALLLSGQTGGSIGSDSLATPLPVGGPKLRVSVLTAIDSSTLPADTEELEVFVYALGPKNEVVGSTSHRWTFAAERRGRAKGIKLFTSLELPPGRFSLRVLVSHPGSGAFGLDSRPLVVPGLTGTERALLATWLLEPLEPWLVALPAEGAGGEEVRPLIVDSRLHLPAPRPVLEAGGTLTACLLARRPGAPPWKLRALFAGAGGPFAAPLEVLEHRLAPWPDLELLLVSTRVPDLPAGRYRLRVDLRTGRAEPLVSPGLPLIVTAPRREPRSASRLEGDPATRTAVRLQRGGKLPRRQIAAGYRQILRTLAAGDVSAAAALLDFEIGVDRRAPGALFQDFEKIQWQVLAELGEGSWGRLLPVARLHADLIPEYRQRGSAPLTEHSLRVSSKLAKTIGRQATARDDRADASRILTGLAGCLLRRGRLGESAELFALAVQLEDGNREARLGLAVSHERLGRYQEASLVLQRLSELDADHAEARLRLALNLERLGKTARSRPLLESLRQPGVAEWIAVLAFEESARAAMREQRYEEALGILDAGLGRWPRHPGLSIQRAQVLDRSARPREARELIDRLVLQRPGFGSPSSAASESGTPRDRYNRWPERATEATRPELSARIDRRLADLGRALAPEPGTQEPGTP